MVREYKSKIENKDFIIDNEKAYKGSRTKKLAQIGNKKAFLKYPAEGYKTTELCSEKICYELASIIGFKCARIEFAKDSSDRECILNYLFVDVEDAIETHTDIKDFLNKNGQYISLKEYYNLENILNNLYEIAGMDNERIKLVQGFIKIMVFDALVGETDRHDENWGIIRKNGKCDISPLYDNSANLLREFRDNDNKVEKLLLDDEEMLRYINKSKTLIYSEKQEKISHFEVIDTLKIKYPSETTEALLMLKKLTDEKIDQIINRIPKEKMKENHKEAIKKYIKFRKDILLKKIGG